MKINLLLLYLLLATLQTYSTPIFFRHLTVADGLSHNSGMTFYQDERGFIWIGTRNGLNLYNGQNIQIFRYNKKQPESLHSNLIHQITGDSKGNVYIRCNKGLVRYNIPSNRFSRLTNHPVESIYFNQDLYYCQGDQIYRWKEKGEKEEVFHLAGRAAGQNILCLLQKADSILAGTSNGLYLLKGGKTICLIEDIRPSDLFCDSHGWIWITSYDGKGLYCLKNGKIEHFFHSNSDPESLSHNQTHRCCEDHNGNIWISTFHGLDKYNRETGKFTAYYAAEANGLTESSVWGLMCDRQGIIWAGTYYGGVNYFTPTSQYYQKYYAVPNDKNGLSSPIIGEMTTDIRGDLWLCTEGGGICRYIQKENRFQQYQHNESSNSLSHNHAKCLYYDADSDLLWIGTHLGGLNRMDISTGQFKHYRHNPQDTTTIPSDIIMSITPYQNRLLLGGQGQLALFDPSTGKSVPFFSSTEEQAITNYTYALHVDSQNNLWIISGAGQRLCKYDIRRRTLKEYKHDPNTPNSISGNLFNAIYEDSHHRIWICSNGNGLDLYHPETDRFENFDTDKNGLGSNVVYEIRELSDGKMIVTTDQGFSVLNEASKTFTNYERGRDFPLNSVNEHSLYYSTTTKEIFIGGLDGMVSFQEEILHKKPHTYSIFPYKLTVNGAVVSVQDGTGILKQDISMADQITLHAGQDVFTLEYTTTNFLPVKRDRLSYQLDGYSKKWIPLNEENLITYTNLPSGNYTLKVKATDENGETLSAHQLHIRIIPPLYRSGWAYAIYLAAALLIVLYLQKMHNTRIRLSEQIIYEKKHAEDIEQLNQSKLSFFTNISHEFRTPLSIILGQMEILLARQQAGSSLHIALKRVYQNCQQLNSLITELLDFRKLEQGFMTIHARQQDIVGFLHSQYRYFEDYAFQKNIDFRFEKSHQHILLWFDDKQMQKVINNLLSNAFKYVSPKGRIVLSVRKADEEVLIEVTNTGNGIKPEDINRIFDRFYQADYTHSSTGTGIGLNLTKGIVELHHGRIEAYSNPGDETTFRVHLLTGYSHFKPEEIEPVSPANAEELESKEVPDNEENLAEPLPLTDDHKDAETTVTSPASKCKMLIVEDQQTLRNMLVELFTPFYHIQTAVNGKEGWEKVQAELPDIVLSDVVMPEMEGTELCRLIKETKATCHIPVIILTACIEQEQILKGWQTGADDYIVKPFDIQLLISRCNNLIKNRMRVKEQLTDPSSTITHIPQQLANDIQSQDFINKATEAIRRHLENSDLSVQLLAQELGISRTLLFTKCKKATGQTPLEFILDIRIQEAAKLLDTHPEYNVNEIGDRTGFTSPKLFRQHFKERFQMTPTEYRRRKRP